MHPPTHPPFTLQEQQQREEQQKREQQQRERQRQQHAPEVYGQYAPAMAFEKVGGFGQMFPEIESRKNAMSNVARAKSSGSSSGSSGGGSSSSRSSSSSNKENNAASKAKGRRKTYKSPYQQPLEDIYTNSIRRANEALAARGAKASSVSAKRRDGRDDASLLPKVKGGKGGRRIASAGPVLVSPGPRQQDLM